MAGHGGGARKVAYADFVTAMMAFFLVMWITAQNNAVKQAIAQYFQDPTANSQRSSGGPPMLPSNKGGQPPGPSMIASGKSGSISGMDRKAGGWFTTKGKAFEEPPDKLTQENEITKPGLFIVRNDERRYMGAMILFPEGSTKLDETSKDRLIKLAGELRGKPQKIEIRGHATRISQTTGSAEKDAWQISYARCLATMNFLVQQGIEPERIRLSQGGAYEPYSLAVDQSQRVYNSRVEVFMLDEYAEDLMGTPEQRSKRFVKPADGGQ